MSYYLALVSPLDAPLFEAQLSSTRPSAPSSTASTFPSWSSFTSTTGSDLGPGPGETRVGGNLGLLQGGAAAGPTQPTASTVAGGPPFDRALAQMVAYKSLDSVEEILESSGGGSLYLRTVDKHNEWNVSAFIAGGVKFVLLHDNKNDDGIRLFFLDLWELYVKVLLSPFHTINTPIRNPLFEAKVRQSAKRNL